MNTERPSVQAQFKPEPRKEAEPKRTDYWNPTLNIRFQAGHCMGFLYTHLIWLNFDPSIGIILHYSSHTVKLEGRNLKPLYEELMELRLRQIDVVDQLRDDGDTEKSVVHRALVTQVNNETSGGGEESDKKSRSRKKQ